MLRIRPAEVTDVSLLYRFLYASASDQGFADALAVSEADLIKDGFGREPRFQALIAEVDGAPAGLALYFFTYSTWGSRNGLYLEDLYVAPEFRGRGVGRTLLERLEGEARARGCGRFQWVVHRHNAAARRLYEAFGASGLEDWLLMSRKL